MSFCKFVKQPWGLKICPRKIACSRVAFHIFLDIICCQKKSGDPLPVSGYDLYIKVKYATTIKKWINLYFT